MTFKLLIVDDHPETRSIIGRVLQQQGYQVVSAPNGLEGLKLADQEKPDLILLDFMMPVMDGRETCERLRQKPEMAKVPIIMFTAVDDPQQKLSVFDAGADDYLNKPTEPAELIDRVQTLLETAYGPLPDSASHTRGKTKASLLSDDPPAGAGVAPISHQLIAILGARGGAGATTLSINLAATYADLGYTTTLVDLDMDQGHVGLYLNQKNANGVNALSTLADNEISEQLPEFLLPYGRNLRLLLTQMNQNGRFPHLSGPQTAVLMTTLMQTNQLVFVDLGNRIDEAARAVITQADQILVCLQPQRIALFTARQLLAYLREIIPPYASLGAMMLNFAENEANLPATAVAGFIGQPLIATLTIPPAEMVRAVNKALPLVIANPASPLKQQLLQLGQQLLKAQPPR